MKRLSKKSEKVIWEMTDGGRFFENPLSVMAREGARMMLRVAIKEEMTATLGRDVYERTQGGLPAQTRPGAPMREAWVVGTTLVGPQKRLQAKDCESLLRGHNDTDAQGSRP